MKILLASLSFCLALNLFTQTINSNSQPIGVAQYTDTLKNDLNKFTSEYAIEISTWSQERKKWFITFG